MIRTATSALPSLASDSESAPTERPLLHEHARDDAAPLLEAGLEDHAASEPIRIRLELEQLRGEQDHVQQLLDVGAALRRDLDAHVLAAELFDDDAVLRELVL